MDIVPDDITQAEIIDEANYRARQAGYPVTRDGRPMPLKIQGLVAFGPRKLNLWPRDKHGKLIE